MCIACKGAEPRSDNEGKAPSRRLIWTLRQANVGLDTFSTLLAPLDSVLGIWGWKSV